MLSTATNVVLPPDLTTSVDSDAASGFAAMLGATIAPGAASGSATCTERPNPTSAPSWIFTRTV